MISRQPLVACPVLVVTVILASMTRTGFAEARHRPVAAAAQDRKLRGAVPAADPDQEAGPGSRDLRGQEPGAEVPVGEQDHARVQAGEQCRAQVVSPLDTGLNTASMTVRVPQLTRTSSRSIG